MDSLRVGEKIGAESRFYRRRAVHAYPTKFVPFPTSILVCMWTDGQISLSVKVESWHARFHVTVTAADCRAVSTRTVGRDFGCCISFHWDDARQTAGSKTYANPALRQLAQ